jgi:small subunit ribosomal protein S5
MSMVDTFEDSSSLESTTVGIFRTATVVKGGRRFSFAALVVVGDRAGSVGIGYGKGRGVPAAIEKAQKDARKSMFSVSLIGGTLPHTVNGKFGASKVRLIPAAPGTGVIAGGTVRAVLEMAGVQDCLSKVYGSTNKKNLCKACANGLQQMRMREQIASHRGVEIKQSDVEAILELSRKTMEDQKADAESHAQPKQQQPAAKAAPAPAPAKEKPAPSAVETKSQPTPPAPEASTPAPQQPDTNTQQQTEQ